MASTSQPVNLQPAGRQSFGTRMNQFWQRVTDGLELNQLWNQFRTDARASYRLYSREIDSTPTEGVKTGRHWWEVSKQFFWAILEKLSPARRVLLLVALLMILFRSEEHTSELQSQSNLVCRLLLEKKKKINHIPRH